MKRMAERAWIFKASRKSLAKNGAFLLMSLIKPPQNLQRRARGDWRKMFYCESHHDKESETGPEMKRYLERVRSSHYVRVLSQLMVQGYH